jgi:formylglycine-generating enzyme required for sulfatase activity/serine/threonine protein kinase
MPQTLGKYLILDHLGSGATADVYHARDTVLGREVALKVLKPALVPDSQAYARFVQEARAAAQLFHPYIATVLDIAESDGRYYIAMRYIPGRSLDHILKETGALAWDETLRLAQHIASALDHAHQQGFLHRDVKPSNIVRSDKGDYVLTDFGLTRAMMSTGLTSHTGAVLGTPAYIAPEIWLGEKAVPATDQYALACAVYKALTGQALFTGETPPAIMTAHVLKGARLPAEWPAGVPEGIATVLEKALSKVADERYPNTREFARALQETLKVSETFRVSPPPLVPVEMELAGEIVALESSTHPQVPETSQVPGSVPTPVHPPSSAEAPPPKLPSPLRGEGAGVRSKPRRSFPWKWLLLGVGVIGIGIVVAVILSQPSGADNVAYDEGLYASQTAAAAQEQSTHRSATETASAEERYAHATETANAAEQAAQWGATETAIAAEQYAQWSATETAVAQVQVSNSPVPLITQVSEIDGMVLVPIPAGTFRMGSENGNLDEQPVHSVTLDAFWMDQTEVTNAMYAQCVTDEACTPHRSSGYNRSSYYGNPEFDHYPVVFVDWIQAQAYCTWAGRRLPTEAEWEYAARGGLEGAMYPWGDDSPVCTLGAVNGAQFADCSPYDTLAVGSFAPNGYGIFDMAGNVWEWVADRYDASYYRNSPSDNPIGPDSGDYRVLRGGAWSYDGDDLRVSNRSGSVLGSSGSLIGFRCSLSP